MTFILISYIMVIRIGEDIMARKPFIVFLMDGMGIEDSKSYNIYGSDVMPTLDSLTNRYLFSSLNSDG